MKNAQDNYVAPSSREELVARYSQGERSFPGTDLSGADLSRVVLDGANFEVHSWFFDANFEGASLRGVSFRECNVKCASFKNADLTGASFEGAAIESVDMSSSVLKGVKFVGQRSTVSLLKKVTNFRRSRGVVSLLGFSVPAVEAGLPHNKRIKFARYACPTRNGEAPLLAAYARR